MSETEDQLNSLNALNLIDINQSASLVKAICYGLDDEKNAKNIISFINKQLSSALTRDKGVAIVYKILPHCSTKILEDNCIIWTNYCMSHHINEPVPALRFNTAQKLMVLCNKNQDYNKAITSNLLAKIIEACTAVAIKSSIAIAAIDCLRLCLLTYPSTCIVYKKKIEVFLSKFIDASVTRSVLDSAAACLHALNQVGGCGPSGSTHIKNFNDNFEKMCNTLNSLYDELFKDVNEFENYSSKNDFVYEFRSLASNLDASDVTRIISRRLRNVTVFITKMLECAFPVKKSFNPEHLLNIIQRGISVHLHADLNDTSKSLHCYILQEHQIDLLHLLKALICCLKHNFIHFSSIKILLDSLLRTKSCDCFKKDCEYQIATYEVLKYWILNSGEQIESKLYDKIIKHIISDITPFKTAIVLNISNVGKSPKAKNKIIQEKVINSGDANKSDITRKMQENIEDICLEALITLELLLKKIPLTVKPTTIEVLFETLVHTLLNISVNIHEVPYTNKNCRARLYKVLIAIFDQTSAVLDIALVINILNIGVHNYDNTIAHICAEGLTQLEKICQPISGSLYVNIGSNLKAGLRKEVDQVEIEENDLDAFKLGQIGLINGDLIADDSSEAIADASSKANNDSSKAIDDSSKALNDSSEAVDDNLELDAEIAIEIVEDDVISVQNDDLNEDEEDIESLRIDESPQTIIIDEDLEEINDSIENNHDLDTILIDEDENPIKRRKFTDENDDCIVATFVDEIIDD